MLLKEGIEYSCRQLVSERGGLLVSVDLSLQ
jgi:hypothetical protein